MSLRIDPLTLIHQIFRASTTGDGSYEAGADSGEGKQTAKEIQGDINRLQTVLQMAEYFPDLDVQPTIHKIELLQQKRNEVLEDSFEQ